jgi:hypothetical protein
MTTKRRISYWRHLRRWPAIAGASAALIAGATGVIGAPPKNCNNCVDCRYTVDGVCIPNAVTYGYYQTQWRTWPRPIVASTTSAPRTETKLPTQIEPPPAQEDLDNAPRPPAGDMGETPPVKPATGDEQIPPKVDKPDPFQDDPVQNGDALDGNALDSDVREETSILVPPLSAPVETYGLYEEELPALPRAVQSNYDAERNANATVVPATTETPAATGANLRLVGNAPEPVVARPKAKSPTADATPEGANPLRGGWNTRGESPLRDPKVVTQFGGAASANPLRK